MAEVVKPNTVISWFTEYQKNHIVRDGVIPKWFHGIISRKQAEELLMTKPPGCFLIRVSESRIGYTLSYRAEEACRHFMIGILPGNQCEIVGENLRHCSLHDLVAFHSRTPIRPFTELLTEACDQVGEIISEDLSPSLCRESDNPFSNQNLSNSSAVSSSSRLYPSLDQELSSYNLESPLNLSPKSCQKSIVTPQELTTRWHYAHEKNTNEVEQSAGLPTDCNQGKSEGEVLQNSQAESKQTRIRLIKCKKIFKKKKKHLEEHLYMEINETKVTTEPAALQIGVNPDQDEADKVFSKPAEYLNPPPFAPGY